MFSLNEPVHRLIDMVVEEVSLVDRAANKRRFLIVKRDEEMGQEDKQQENSLLGAAVAALDGATKIVEMLGQSGGENVDAQVKELASQLRAASEQLYARLTGTEPPSSEPPSEKKEGEEPKAPSFAENIEAAKQAISQLSEIAAKVPTPAPAAGDATAPPPEPLPASPPSEDALASLTDSFKSLSDTVKQQHERLTQVEKNVGLPNSVPPSERVEKSDAREVSWPLDLNNSKDRESVDKSVSFHDL